MFSFFWGMQQKKGLRELQAGLHSAQQEDTASAVSQLEFAERAFAEGGEDYLAQLARISLGQIAEHKGDWVAARQHYEKGAEIDGPAQAEALLAAARISALMKDDGASSLYYKKFLEQYPDSLMGELIRQKMEGS
jgi:Tfp pilus assembly protein PilF